MKSACGNCSKPFGLRPPEARIYDWATRKWRTFCSRNCKREFKAKRKADRARTRAALRLYRAAS